MITGFLIETELKIIRLLRARWLGRTGNSSGITNPRWSDHYEKYKQTEELIHLDGKMWCILET